MSELERDTEIEPDEGGWVGRIEPHWNIGTNPNGGYTLALAARAMLAACQRPDPLTITAHYVAPPAMGAVVVRPEIVRTGRRYATVAASMEQDGRELIRLIGAFGDLGAQAGPTRLGATMPSITPPEDCIRMVDFSDWGGGRPMPEVVARYDLRLDPTCQWVRSRAAGDSAAPADAGGEPAAPARAAAAGDGPGATAADGSLPPLEVTGWTRFADGSPPSVLGLLAMADAFPPTMVGHGSVGWVPTIELTVHVRRRPAPGWILGAFTTRFLIDGLLEQDGELWDSAGGLVALCRQMALVLPPR